MSGPITRSITVKGNIDGVYNACTDFENFPHFVKHIRAVSRINERTIHWVLDLQGAPRQWDTEITRLEPNKRIAWSSKDTSDAKTSGQMTFVALPQNETQVTVTLHYTPTGPVGQIAARLGNLEKTLDEILRNFKAYKEGMHERIT